MGCRNVNVLIGLGLPILGFIGQYLWAYSWVILIMGGLIYISSLFFAKDPDCEKMPTPEFLDLLTLGKASIGVRLLHFGLAAITVLAIVFVLQLWEYAFLFLFPYAVFVSFLFNWYRTQVQKKRLVGPETPGAGAGDTALENFEITINKGASFKDLLKVMTFHGAPGWVRGIALILDAMIVLAAVNYQRLGYFFFLILFVCILIKAPLFRKYVGDYGER